MDDTELPLEMWIVRLRYTQIFDRLHLASNAALVYYYATTFDQEVERIWPQPTWRAGRVLFLASRYANILSIIVRNIHNNWRTGVEMSLYTCNVLEKTTWALNVIGISVVPEMIFWLCLYALLGGKRKFLYVLIVAFFSFLIPLQVLQGIFISTRQSASTEGVYKELGYSCVYEQAVRFDLYSAGAYLAFARTTLVMTIAITTLVLRYRKQNGSLIKAIRHEGGMYYVSAFILSFFGGLTNMPNSPLFDQYQLIPPLRLLLIPVFADRLLLQMQSIYDPGTRIAVTTLMFDHTDSDDSHGTTTDEDWEYPVDRESVHGVNRGSVELKERKVGSDKGKEVAEKV